MKAFWIVFETRKGGYIIFHFSYALRNEHWIYGYANFARNALWIGLFESTELWVVVFIYFKLFFSPAAPYVTMETEALDLTVWL